MSKEKCFTLQGSKNQSKWWNNWNGVVKEEEEINGRQGGSKGRELHWWAFLSLRLVRSKVYDGFNFTFSQPIRVELRLRTEL